MSLRLEWVLSCYVCNKTERLPANVLDMICDSDPVRVKQPQVDVGKWKTDGLAGWMCAECYKSWKPKKEKK